MKNIALNSLAGLALLAIVAVAFVVLTIYSNPYSPLNPFPPPTLPANVVIPTSTLTPIFLPATWTPQPLVLTQARPSSTLIPSATTFKLITNTPTATPTGTATEVVILPTSTPTGLAYFCMLSIAKPLDGGNVDPNSSFDGSWIIKNGGTETWDSSQVEVRYITGARLQTRADTLKLPRDVPTGSSLRFTLDMKAPGAGGTYYSTWGLMQGDRVICRWTIAIFVP
jgi:Ig-like domain from next to BRCA1 gene